MRWYSVGRSFGAAVVAVAVALPESKASAAELRIDFAELAAISRVILSGAEIRLHNVPGSVFDLAAGSSVTIGGSARPIPVPVRSFEAAGARYAYLLNDLNSKGIAVSAVPGAVRLTIEFESEGPELVGRCLSGFCPPQSALPDIEWQKPEVTVDLVPVGLGSSLALRASKVAIKGQSEPRCRTSAGFLSASLCKAALGSVRATVARLRQDLDSALMQQMNAAPIQEKIAASLQSFLKVGPAGEVRISRVAVDGAGTAVVVSFCLACAAN